MTPDKNVNAGTRLGSMLLDHILMTVICMLFFIPLMIKGFAGAFNISHEQKDMDGFGGPLLSVGLLGFALYFCKDCINGRSLGKRITKLQVLDNKTGQVASPIKSFVRNIFCIIWPVEVIVTLANPSRRIGDFVAGTKVASYEPAVIEQPEFDFRKVLVPIGISFGLMLLIMLPFQSLKPSFSKVQYVESSYNETESKSLEKLFSDSLGQYLAASARVYEKVANQNVKYISIIYRLKENYLEDESNSRELKRLTNELLYSKFPESSFTGQAKYVYQSGGTMQASSNQIGTYVSEAKK